MGSIKPVIAAGGVLYKEDGEGTPPEIITIFRRGVWDLPKGKLEEGEEIKECAVREVAEEIGLSQEPYIEGELEKTYHEYEQDGTYYGKTTYWYAMRLDNWDGESLTPQHEEGIEKVQWYPLEEALGLMGYQNLVKVLQSFAGWYQAS